MVFSTAPSEARPVSARDPWFGGSYRSGPSASLAASRLALAIFHGCTTQAIAKASDNPKFVEAIGLPIARGPWYDSSLEVGHRRRSVSCTFPVSGPHGSGLLQIKAIGSGEDGMLSFLRHHDWEILVLEAHFHVPSDGDEEKSLVKVNLMSSCSQPSTSEDYEQPDSDSQAD